MAINIEKLMKELTVMENNINAIKEYDNSFMYEEIKEYYEDIENVSLRIAIQVYRIYACNFPMGEHYEMIHEDVMKRSLSFKQDNLRKLFSELKKSSTNNYLDFAKFSYNNQTKTLSFSLNIDKHYRVNRLCKHCQKLFDKSQRIKEQYKPDEELCNDYYSHGLSTGLLHEDTPEEGIKNLKRILKNNINANLKKENPQEICCTDKSICIGSTGIYCKGDVKLVSNLDLFSFSYKGIRYWGFHDKGDEINSKGFKYEYVSEKKDYKLHNNVNNNEIILSKPQILAIWVKDWATDRQKEAMRLIAKKLNIPMCVVEEQIIQVV